MENSQIWFLRGHFVLRYLRKKFQAMVIVQIDEESVVFYFVFTSFKKKLTSYNLKQILLTCLFCFQFFTRFIDFQFSVHHIV